MIKTLRCHRADRATIGQRNTNTNFSAEYPKIYGWCGEVVTANTTYAAKISHQKTGGKPSPANKSTA
jgi:hypothetical protein